ncbi:acetamidase/formamidase family protein [Oceanobacillus neutriphilus]|uniref:Acetamidase n=1 Tax=Oceanobacillus neutriphilus TaxID=531815 RepID=A0ABQ2NNF8_9BACI|nr:acetamidase/formamidase family protein [Oceanobacillus neutriphilus]GGP07771.1 acetamidase [Oceanobacillus neutriphilus]
MKNEPAKQIVYVNTFTDGILDPEKAMLGPVKDGGYIIANTAPGCWGPMITPSLQGGHEVTQPVYVEGAEVGDAVAIHISSIQVTSMVTASGNDRTVEGHFISDPFVDAKCPECGIVNPDTVIADVGSEAVRCSNCGAAVNPFQFTNGYTIAFDDDKTIGVTLPKEAAEAVGKEGRKNMCTPEHSVQNPIVSVAPHDIVGMVARVRPFLGQIGTTPARAMPDSHNAGDFGQFLLDAPHDYGITKEQLEERTDGHMDINRVREGAILICPVKTDGGGIYLGDMHAMQGNGEIAGHTTDVSGIATLKVSVLKGIKIDGPILLPVEEDLPYNGKPLSEREKSEALKVAKAYGFEKIEETAPVSFIGTGADLNEATDNGLNRAASVLGMSVPEVMNRATVTGSVDIGRNPGVVTVTFLAPLSALEDAGLGEIAVKHYCL